MHSWEVTPPVPQYTFFILFTKWGAVDRLVQGYLCNNLRDSFTPWIAFLVCYKVVQESSLIIPALIHLLVGPGKQLKWAEHQLLVDGLATPDIKNKKTKKD